MTTTKRRSVVVVRVVALVVLAGAAIGLAPRPKETQADAPAWPEPVVRVASLGRTYAGADVAWLRTVQVIGSDKQARAGYPTLDTWVDVVTALDPAFVEPYFFGAILLVTDDTRADHVDALLARAEQAMPDTFTLPFYRGFIANFGKMDPVVAAGHMERAASKPDAPRFVKSMASRLRTDTNTCGSLMQDLQQISEGSHAAQRQALQGERRALFQHCLEVHIERVANAWRVKNGKIPTIDDLVAEGLLDPAKDLSAPPGMCWRLSVMSAASLEPCSGAAP
jgi:hypothetical protein